jgi:hypothetical protein
MTYNRRLAAAMIARPGNHRHGLKQQRPGGFPPGLDFRL